MVVLLPAVDLAAILLALICALMLTGALIILTPVLKWVGDQIPLIGGWASSKLLGAIQYFRDEVWKSYHHLTHFLVVVIAGTAQALEDFTVAVWNETASLESRLQHTATAGLHQVLGIVLAPIRHELSRAYHLLHVITGWAHHEISLALHAIRRLEHTVFGGLVPLVHHLETVVIGDLRREEAAIQHAIDDVITPELARLAKSGALSAAAVAALEVAMAELSSLRCGNVANVGRWLCGLDPTILNALLSIAGDALILELMAKAGVSVSDPFSWAENALGDLETIAATY